MAASALSGKISGTGVYEAPENVKGIEYGYGTGLPASPLSALDSIVEQLDSLIDRVESSVPKEEEVAEATTSQIYPGFPEKISGEILFCDMENLDVSYPPAPFSSCLPF